MKVSFAATLAAAAMSVAFAEDFCDQWGQTTSGPYIIYNNLWGSSAATGGGKQCTGLDTGSGDTVAWHTTWSWQGGDKSVKSFANAALEFDPVPLTEVKSIPSTMAYTVKYSGNVVADVAYDLFTSSTADGEKEFEIMIWLAAIGGAGPISSTGQAIDSTTIDGTEWSVYSGPNGQMTVYSFVASKQVENFEGDLMEFFNYLVQSQSFKNSQYLIKVECGTEPFVGTDVTMTVSKYSAVVNTGAAGSAVQEEASGSSDASTPAATTAAATSTTGSSTQEGSATSTTGSSDAAEPATSSTGSSSEAAPATSTAGSSVETETSGSSDETETSGSSDATTPATSSTGSSSEQTPATSTAGSSEQTPATSTAGSSDETETSGSSDASAPATSSTGSSSEQTPTTSAAGSSDEQQATTAPSTGSSLSAATPAPASKCSRRIRRE
jgi:xyloglucan-specific endo-beta-1,4-glucanase